MRTQQRMNNYSSRDPGSKDLGAKELGGSISSNASGRLRTGFTLIELMVTVAVFGILVAMAIPTFGDLLLRNTVSSDTNDFIVAVNSARSEAIKRNQTVNFKAEAGGWANGYFVEIASSSERIREFATNANSATPSEANAYTEIAFSGTGIPTPSDAEFEICKTSGEEGRTIDISTIGRVSVADLVACP